MGTIVTLSPEDLYQEIQGEKCISEGGHFFERTGETVENATGDGILYCVTCERCYIEGFETPDESDLADDGFSDEARDIL